MFSFKNVTGFLFTQFNKTVHGYTSHKKYVHLLLTIKTQIF